MLSMTQMFTHFFTQNKKIFEREVQKNIHLKLGFWCTKMYFCKDGLKQDTIYIQYRISLT